MQERQPDDPEDADHPGPAEREQLGGRVQGATRGDQVIHKENLLPRVDVAPMHLEDVFPVFQK